MNRWLLPAALGLGVVVLVAIWFTGATDKAQEAASTTNTPNDSIPLFIQWHAGMAQQYRVLSESSMQMETTTAGGASSIRVQLQGLLNMLTLESDMDEVLVGFQLSSVELKINDVVDSDTNQALGIPFRVRFAGDGMPRAFEYPAELSTRNRSILENLVRTFQVSLDNADNWVTQETNASGSYEAAYKRTGQARIEKSKRRFNNTAAGMLPWSDLESTETILLEAGRDWLASMTVAETMRSEGQGGPAMAVHNHATLELMPGVRLTLQPDTWQFAASVAAVDDMATMKARRPVPNMTPEEARRQILATVPELDAAKQGRLALVHRLRDLLLVDASLSEVILDVLKTQDLDDRTRADLYLALEQAGTESAQAALVSVIIDSSWSLKDGMRAIVAMGGIKAPATESVSALWDTAQSAYGDERQRMANAAAFALGSVGNTMREADDPEYASLRSSLLSSATGTFDVNQRSNFITALGNTNDPTLANEVVEFMNDSEPAIRRAAALSLGTLGTDQVADTLMSHYRHEDNGYVRGAIAESLQSWTQPTDSAMAMFRQAVRTEADERTRYNIAVLLGENLQNFPENEAALREIMRTEPSKRIRQKVAEALASNNGK
ncbi:MAG: HEAT repeat domain-containing protein [Thiotrichales bacterium]|nr:MAG: HEAT repeat domain-containing protein [Thiotrichales bacterium]